MCLYSKIYTVSRIIGKVFNKLFAYIIILKYGGDFWKIKEMLNKLSNGARKNRYLAAYREIMKNKGSMISVNSQFDGTPDFPHDIHGIFISHSAKIGKNCTIFHQVTIGSNRLPDSKGKGAPIIGDNCYIGAGAKIIGKVRMGNNCRIGANCVVVKDLPDNSVAVHQPPRIIQKKELDNVSQHPIERL